MNAIVEAVLFTEIPASRVTNEQLEQCATLFSCQYGVWASSAPPPTRPGARVRTTAARLKEEHLFDDQCWLLLASLDNTTIGHACVRRYMIPDKGLVSWVTQLVVDAEYRSCGVAKKLCRMAWAVERFFAAGLVTSHPHAVRALERATERACSRDKIKDHAAELLHFSGVPYATGRQLRLDNGRCLIDTDFFVDHTEVEQTLAQMIDWRLGPLEDGKEFFAFVFAVSPKVSPTPSQEEGPLQEEAGAVEVLPTNLFNGICGGHRYVQHKQLNPVTGICTNQTGR